MKFERFILLPGYETNCYLLWDEVSLEALLIDPAEKSDKIVNRIAQLKLKLKYIVNTHGHGDHIGGNGFFAQKFNVPIMIHKKDAKMLSNSTLNLSAFINAGVTSPKASKMLEDGDELLLGECKIRVITVPGHTAGGIALYTERLLFSGDTLFLDSVGRTDFPGGSMETLLTSIKSKLYVLPDDTAVLPGHSGYTTIGYEKENNMFVH